MIDSVACWTRSKKRRLEREPSKPDKHARVTDYSGFQQLPSEILEELLMPYLSLHDCHHSLPQVSKPLNILVKSRLFVTQRLCKPSKLKIPRFWIGRLLHVKYIGKAPPRVRFPPNIRTLELESIVIDNFSEDIGASLLEKLTDLTIKDCKIDGFDGICGRNLSSLQISNTVLHSDYERAESGRIEMMGMPNLMKLRVDGGCCCTHILIGDLFTSCKNLLYVSGPLHFDEFLDPITHSVPTLRELHFSRHSHNLIQIQADALPFIAPNLLRFSHLDVRVWNIDFIKKFVKLLKANFTLPYGFIQN